MKRQILSVALLLASIFSFSQPNDFKYYKSLGLVHYYEKNYLEAVFNLQKAVDLNSKDAEAAQLLRASHDSLGHHEVNGKTRLSEKYLKENTGFRPNLSAPTAEVINTKSPGGKAPGRQQLQKADPFLYKDIFQLGNFFLDRGSYDSAAICYKRYLATNPNDTVALYYLSASNYFLKRFDDAKAGFQTILSYDNKRADIYNWLGVCELLQSNYLAARDNFKQCLLLDPLYTVGYYNLGKTQFELEDIGGAIKNLEKAQEFQQNDADVKNILGECYYRIGQYQQARKVLTPIYEANKKSARINFILGEAAMKVGEWQQATEYYEAYSRLIPEASEAFKKLGIAYFKLEKYTYALDCFDKASKTIWDDKDLMINAAIASNKLGDNTKALDYANRAIALDANNSRAYYQMAVAYQGLGEKKLAKNNFKKSKELEANSMEP
ncbi:MAG: tetratricopeptide repeat protein [Chitinophagales bacterium]